MERFDRAEACVGVDARRLDERERRVVREPNTTGALVRPRRFEDFYRSNREDLVRALALTLRDPHLAAEAADEAMVRAYQHWRSLVTYDNPAGWTYRVGLNWARSWLRKRRREVPEMATEPPVWDPDPVDPSLAQEIGSLSDKHRAVIVLRFFWDWRIDQIADALDISPGTVKSRLHRALRQLRSNGEVTR